MKMRANGNLEIRYPGPFGLSDWEYGKWSKTGNTFSFTFDRGKEATNEDDMLSDTMVVYAGILEPVNMPPDSVKTYKDYLFKLRSEK